MKNQLSFNKYLKFKYPIKLTYKIVSEDNSYYYILVNVRIQKISKTVSNIKQIIYEYR